MRTLLLGGVFLIKESITLGYFSGVIKLREQDIKGVESKRWV